MKTFLTVLIFLCSISVNAQNWTAPNYYTNLYTPTPIVYPTVINHDHYCENSNQFIANGGDLLIGDIIDGLINSIVRISKNKKRKRINKTRRTKKLRFINMNRTYTYSR